MSKTIEERAAAYALTFPVPKDDREKTIKHLTAFAASEVARVRREQRAPLNKLTSACVAFGGHGQSKCTVCGVREAIEAATRPERPARAEAKPRGNPLTGDPRGDLGTIARKHGMKLTITPAERFDPTLEPVHRGGLSSLARTVKKRGAR